MSIIIYLKKKFSLIQKALLTRFAPLRALLTPFFNVSGTGGTGLVLVVLVVLLILIGDTTGDSLVIPLVMLLVIPLVIPLVIGLAWPCLGTGNTTSGTGDTTQWYW